jgi:hypothetical protein
VATALLHKEDLHTITPEDTGVTVFWFEELAHRNNLGVSPEYDYWNGCRPWNNCGGLGYLYYLWISAVFDTVVPEPERHFVCMNHNPRPHRIQFLDLLWKEGLFGYASVSFPESVESPWREHTVPWLGSNRGPSTVLPVLPPPVEAFGTVAFSLITETNTELFDISEKTFQCLSVAQPFLVWGCAGVQAWLRARGFRDLPGVDYSYDSILDNDHRQRALVAEVKRLTQQDPQRLSAAWTQTALYNQSLYRRIHRRLRLPFESSYDRVGSWAQRQIDSLLTLQRDYLLYQNT